jgi:multiple sugar transport system substrate-binding protein
MLAVGVDGSGSSAAAADTVTLHWYTAPQNGGSFDAAAAACSKASNGRYHIALEPLPADASQQREQLVRRLAADDSDIDLISMDVNWTAEFGEAGWVVPWPKDLAAKVSEGVIPAVLATGRYHGRMYGGPLNTGSQLLWYRKDLVPNPPATWDEMIEMAESLPAGERAIAVQGARYEGFTVWFNSLLASAGGRILDRRGNVSLARKPTEAALRVMRNVATARGADPSLSNNKEDESNVAFEAGKAAFMVNYSFVYPAAKADAPKVFKNLGVALWPRVDPDQPARVTLGGFNVGVGAFGAHRRLAFEAAQCLGAPKQQVGYAVKDGLPPVSEALYQDPRVRKAFPYAELLLQTFRDGSTRPVSPANNDISLAVQRTLHPPRSIDPKADVGTLRSRVDDAIHSRGLL